MLKIIRYWLCFCLILSGTSIVNSAGGKRVYINKNSQTLTAYEGDKVIISCPVSTGRAKSPTPSGSYSIGAKEKMHRSRLYNNTPMPNSMQLSGNYFMHGGPLPGYPASHGCVRLPYGCAERVYNWAPSGTPVTIGGGQGGSKSTKSKAAKSKSTKKSSNNGSTNGSTKSTKRY